MDCDEFRRNHLAVKMLSGEIVPGAAEEDVRLHLRDCPGCGEWYQARVVEERGEDPSRYACVHLAYFVTRRCQEHPDLFDCPDAIVLYLPEVDEYSIPIRDGKGGSLVPILHCPWCGKATPRSRREEWLAQLEKRGITDPAHADVPEEFRSDRWWRGDRP